MDARNVVLAREATGLDGVDQARPQPGPQVFLGAGLAPAEHFHDGVMHMLGRDVFHRHAVQVVPLVAGGDAFEVARRPRVQPERDLQVFLLEIIGMQRHQFLENAELQRQETRAEHLRVELEQALQHLVAGRGARGALGLGDVDWTGSETVSDMPQTVRTFSRAKSSMKIEKDTVVTLRYKVADANGKLIEESKDPMVYLHGGYENTLPKIEAALDGAKPVTK